MSFTSPGRWIFWESHGQLRNSRELKVGRNHKAQVAVANILRADSEALKDVTTVIAKFYDPLYFDHSDDNDPFLLVDRLYTYETASYERLVDLQGTVIPAYYGSYSLDLPVIVDSGSSSLERTPSVRLILMENVDGLSLRDLNPGDFSQTERKRIMRMIIDGESAIYTCNILQRDLHPRNVLVERATSLGSSQSTTDKITRVVHIDFRS